MSDQQIEARCKALDAVSEAIDRYLSDYEYDDGENCHHLPSESEMILIRDAIQGLLGDGEFLASFNRWQDLLRAMTDPYADLRAALAGPSLIDVTYSHNGHDLRKSDVRALLAERDELLSMLTPAARDVLTERRRQIEQGWTPQHDDEHVSRELARAALCYLQHYVERAWVVEADEDGDERYQDEPPPDDWPDEWDPSSWKPKDPRRDLERAVALALAEIERLDRAKGEPS